MGMMRINPYIAHSELTNEIYIIDRQTKYPVTDQVVKAVVATDRAIPKNQYETRLKADLKAILVELQLEIEEKEQYYQDEFLKSKNAAHDAAMCGRMFGCGECKELIQQKINALKADQEGEEERQPTTKNNLGVDECISKQAALDACHNFAIGILNDYYEKCLKQWIIDLPSVTPQPRKGHWITKPHVYGVTFCSECDFELKIDDTNFCPNCGSDMRAESEEE